MENAYGYSIGTVMFGVGSSRRITQICVNAPKGKEHDARIYEIMHQGPHWCVIDHKMKRTIKTHGDRDNAVDFARSIASEHINECVARNQKEPNG